MGVLWPWDTTEDIPFDCQGQMEQMVSVVSGYIWHCHYWDFLGPVDHCLLHYNKQKYNYMLLHKIENKNRDCFKAITAWPMSKKQPKAIILHVCYYAAHFFPTILIFKTNWNSEFENMKITLMEQNHQSFEKFHQKPCHITLMFIYQVQ